LFRADGRTDGEIVMMNVIVAFRNFATAPKIIRKGRFIQTHKLVWYIQIL